MVPKRNFMRMLNLQCFFVRMKTMGFWKNQAFVWGTMHGTILLFRGIIE